MYNNKNEEEKLPAWGYFLFFEKIERLLCVFFIEIQE